jgi:hypothetical protein
MDHWKISRSAWMSGQFNAAEVHIDLAGTNSHDLSVFPDERSDFKFERLTPIVRQVMSPCVSPDGEKK